MISKTITLNLEHRILFTSNVFSPGNPILDDLIRRGAENRSRSRVIVFVDQGLLHDGNQLVEKIEAYFAAHKDSLELAKAPIAVEGGEACKNRWEYVENLWEHLHEARICRHSYIIAIGGGAVLDLVGFAAATAHRGVRLIRMPTTTLAQDDAGVGVKNGVNFFNKKNWVGTFAVPFAVINDFTFLHSLPARDRRAGLIEAVKVALIRDARFYDAIEEQADALADLEEKAVEFLIRRSAELHVQHIADGGDPFESGSARPLDFGHWAAHKLEQVSNFEILHGEAVALGMTMDLIYARRMGMLTAATETRILDLMKRLGFQLYHPDLERVNAEGKLVVLEGLEEFREHLGGQLSITLVTEVGQALEVHEMDESQIPEIIAEMKERFAKSKPAESLAPEYSV